MEVRKCFYNSLEIKTTCSTRVNKGFETVYIVNGRQCMESDGEQRVFSARPAVTTIEEKRLARAHWGGDHAHSFLQRMPQANG